jgi:ABC-type polysaccharide/polyol phosphate transport system ATPase subunit
MARIEVKNVWKSFSMKHEASTLKEHFATCFKRKKENKEEIWALRDVSFEAEDGDCIGIVGENGSGKTTLLKIIGGMLTPTKGEITIDGKVASLLTLGVGFDPELTAKENVYLYASIMGLSADEIDFRYKEIVDFAELEHFMDTKLRNFSDGMKVRLGFATAINVDADILLVDEVLAVGDGAFQKKCLEKFEELIRQGKIVVLVSHGLEVVENYANNAIFLKNGKVEAIGNAKKVVEDYRRYLKNKELNLHNSRILKYLREAGVTDIEFFNEKGGRWVFETGEKFEGKVKFASLPATGIFDVEFVGRERIKLYSTNLKDKEIIFSIDSLPLPAGDYRLVINAEKKNLDPLEISVVEGKEPEYTKVFSPNFSLDEFFAFGNDCKDVMENFRKGGTIVVFSNFDTASKNCERGAVFKNGKLVLEGEIEKIIEYYKDMLIKKYEEKLKIHNKKLN